MCARAKAKTNLKFKFLMIILILTGSFIFAVGFHLNPPAHAKSTDIYSTPGNFSQLAEMAGPAVVNIRTVKTIKGGGPVFRQFQRNPRGRENPLNDFFEKFFGV